MAALAAFNLAIRSAAVELLAPGIGPPGVGLPGSVCDTGRVSGLPATEAGGAPTYDLAAVSELTGLAMSKALLPDTVPPDCDVVDEIGSTALVAIDGVGDKDSIAEAEERGGGDARVADCNAPADGTAATAGEAFFHEFKLACFCNSTFCWSASSDWVDVACGDS